MGREKACMTGQFAALAKAKESNQIDYPICDR
jgi:hypothetical protein